MGVLLLLGARTSAYLRGAMDLELSAVMLWTDSMIVLHWVKGLATQWKPFVANRTTEVREKTGPSDWRHCQENENRAVGLLPTRSSCDRW